MWNIETMGLLTQCPAISFLYPPSARFVSLTVLPLMIYMSLLKQALELCSNGRLFQLSPVMPGLGERRRVYVSQTINDAVTGPWTNRKEEERWGELRYWFDRFIDGARIYVRERPRAKNSTADMAQLEPWYDEVWEIRAIDPRPSIRIFGSFIQRDVFVGLTWAFRKDLDGFDGPKWRQAIETYQAEWSAFFTTGAMSGAYPNDYLTQSIVLD